MRLRNVPNVAKNIEHRVNIGRIRRRRRNKRTETERNREEACCWGKAMQYALRIYFVIELYT